jgi:aminoglycoside phosphotransferase (APT) family kinase protein
MVLKLVDVMGCLGNIDHEAIGLDGFGQPSGFLERQVSRWRSELESHRLEPGYPPDALPAVDRIASWLEQNRPNTFMPGILHGDLHVGNVLYDWETSDVAAVVDWENSTIGDPLLDLGFLMATMPADGKPTILTGNLGHLGGLPSAAELARRYAVASTRDLSSLDWYVVMSSFKTAIITEGTYARACAGRAHPAAGRLLHAIALELVETAIFTIET